MRSIAARSSSPAPAGFEAVGVVAQPALIYASRQALYLTDMDYTWWGAQRETTDIYKFSFTDTGVELSAVGTVPGRIADQYHMSEYNGDLRVASSTFPRFNQATGVFEESGNHVYVLRSVDGSLEIVGRVENTTGQRLCAVRVEVHLGAGPELGPTPRADVPAGGTIDIELATEGTSFETWTAHPELSACPGA